MFQPRQLLFCLLLSSPVHAQAPLDELPAPGAAPFADLHIHTTFKHFYGDIYNPRELRDIYAHRQDIPYLKAHYGRRNWDARVRKPAAAQAGGVSNLKNYNQSDFDNLRATPGSVLCASLYPYEKQFALTGQKRLISNLFVSGIPLWRLRHTGQPASTPFDEFLTEYAFLQAQEPASPSGDFRIETARDGKDLRRILADPLCSAQVLTIEGGHVLYGPKNAAPGAVRAAATTPDQLTEMLQNVQTLRTLPHKVFFITMAHFTDNRIAGFSKTLDRPGVMRQMLKNLSTSPEARENFFTKFGEGIHGDLDVGAFQKCSCPDLAVYQVPLPYTATTEQGVGRQIIEALLAPDAGSSKRILIDVKHFDLQARFEYYALLRELQVQQKLAKPIPIIAGHVAMSGESLPVAMATALNPLFDRYEELEAPLAFYREQASTWNADWLCRTRNFTPADRAKFFLPPAVAPAQFNPFTVQPLETAAAGWFYPWGINLSNEEVKIIYDSEGIIGLNLDERILGGYMPNYTTQNREQLRQQYLALKAGGFRFQAPEANSDSFDFQDYYACEAFLRNMLQVVQYSGRPDRSAWDRLAIGSDFDGLIDPVNLCPTAAHMPEFSRKAAIYLEVFWKLHQADALYRGQDLFFNGTISYNEAVRKVFFQNARDFVLANF